MIKSGSSTTPPRITSRPTRSILRPIPARHWYGDGIASTIELLKGSLKTGNTLLIGESF